MVLLQKTNLFVCAEATKNVNLGLFLSLKFLFLHREIYLKCWYQLHNFNLVFFSMILLYITINILNKGNVI